MEPIITNLKESFRKGNVSIRLIYLNVAVFVITTLLSVGFQLFNGDASGILSWFELPASFTRLAGQPWTMLTYMFMHADFLHLLFNMLWLYWFGSLFLYFFSAKHLRGLYVLGGICGGLLYMLCYNVFPYFRPLADHSCMVGASASVLAIVTAAAYRQPEYPIRLLFLGALRLKYLAFFVVFSDLLFITSDNAGGHIAHLGGAMAGLCFAAGLNKGIDITRWLNKVIDGIFSLFERITGRRKRAPVMKVHYSQKAEDYKYNSDKKAQSEEVDRILEKLKKSGYESLTTEEKKRLFDASKR